MALSDWDTLALDQDGNPVTGGVQNHLGVSIEIYKNWLYIHDNTKTEQDVSHYGFTSSVVMQMNEGVVTFGGWTIHARRGPKRGVYVVAYSSRWDGDKSLEYPANYVDRTAIVGCGLAGYAEAVEDPRIREAVEANGFDWDYLMTEEALLHEGWRGWLNDEELNDADIAPQDQTAVRYLSAVIDGKMVDVYVEPEDGDAQLLAPRWVGVEQAEVDFLREFLLETIPQWEHSNPNAWPDSLRDIDFANAVRFNQGDAFFAGNLDLGIPGTAPGEGETPLMMQMLQRGEED